MNTVANFRKHSAAGTDWAAWMLGIGLYIAMGFSIIWWRRWNHTGACVDG
jgi:hypothetical protein